MKYVKFCISFIKLFCFSKFVPNYSKVQFSDISFELINRNKNTFALRKNDETALCFVLNLMIDPIRWEQKSIIITDRISQ